MTTYLEPDDITEAIQWRHHLHRNPELGFEEYNTAKFIAEKMKSWGYQVEEGFAGTGIIASLTRGHSAQAIGIRADMDALPIEEKSGVAYASEIAGKMHACGHDGHVAMALAAAKACTKIDFDGTVRFIFQPAEENEGGGREMVNKGLFDKFPVDAIYGLHNWPGEDVGTCIARDDAMMAAFGTFEITITGKGAHGAMPHEGADPVVAVSQIVSALQTITSRNISPLDSSVVSVTQMHGGDAWNIIPEIMIIRGTTRWFKPEVGQRIAQRIKSISEFFAKGFGCEARIIYEERYPSTINTPSKAAIIRKVAALPALNLRVLNVDPSMAAEDFAFMLQKKPGCYFWLGARRDGDNPGLHSPYYDFNDNILAIGTRFWIELVKSELQGV